MDSTLRAERIAAGGDAIAREESGRVVFVTGAIPGELVHVRFTASKRDFARADVIEVVEASPDRRVAPCPEVARGCGGCGWQHIDPERQRALKVDLVADAFRRIAHLGGAEIAEGALLPSERFRTTVRLAADRHGRAGFRSARSHSVVAVDDCLVTHPALTELVPALRLQDVDEIVLRVGARTSERSAVWGPGGAVRGLPADVRVGEAAAVREVVAGVPLRISGRSFFQSSPEAAEALVVAVTEACAAAGGSAGRRIVDAYAGVGLFAATALADATAVEVVEVAPSSVADARVNLAERSVSIHESRVEEWRPVPADLVVADPARAGLGPEAAAVLAATGCEGLVLVSCDAAAAARDVGLLAGHGFQHRRSVVIDPFPHTPHVEVVTLLTRTAAHRAS